MRSLGIVTKKESVVGKFGINENLPMHNWPVDLSEIKSQYDVGMVVSFGNLIPKKLIDELPLWVFSFKDTFNFKIIIFVLDLILLLS